MRKTLEQALERVTPAWSPGLRVAVAARGNQIICPDGSCLYKPGDRCDKFMIFLSGTVRVEHMGAAGRSVVLYRVRPGDGCVNTVSCLLSGEPYQSFGFAEGDVDAIGIPAAGFHDLVDEKTEFRDHVLGVFSQRIIDLVEVIDELLLRRVDLRLAAWLVERSPADGTVRITHQGIAAELGTAREVVSRILKEFERRGWISLTRGEVRLLDPPALESFANAR